MKGLEFQAVAVLGVERGMVPGPAAITPKSEDPVAHAQDLQRERCILFVACTRARDHLYVSGTGEPSVFLPALEPDPPPSERIGAASPGPGESLNTVRANTVLANTGPANTGPTNRGPASARQVGLRELLWLCEDSWRPRLRSASVVAEADLPPVRTRQVAAILGRLYANLRDPGTGGDSLLSRWPACLAAAMAGVAATDYQGGTYWLALWEAVGFQGTAEDQEIWGRAFNTAIGRLGMARFPELSLSSGEPILMHAGIPAYCLGGYFRLLLSRRRLDPGMDAKGFLAWATAPGREARLSQLDQPAQRFLLNGGDYAHDIVDRTLDLLDRLAEPEPDLRAVGLPGYMIEAAKEELTAGHLDLSGIGKRGPGGLGQQARPQIALDPYGQGVHVLLPAVGEMPAGVARWRITTDGDAHAAHTRAMWVGAAGTTPQTACPLDRPARTVHVSLTGHEDLVAELRVIEPADPVLFFDENGGRLPGTLSLPRGRVWIMHPADRELEYTGQAEQLAEPAVQTGWDGWRLRRVSLEDVQAVGLQGGRSHSVEVRARPRLLLGDSLPGVATPGGSLVYAVAPRLVLPQNLGADTRWYAEVRRVGGGAPVSARVVGPAGEIDIWEGIPHPVLGSFEVTVRGPLGRGLRRTIFVAEGLSVAYHPQVRPLTGAGLAAGTARLTPTMGATALPTALRFGAGERTHAVEYRTDARSETLVITPPHVAVLCSGAGVTTWTTSQIHLVAEDFASAGRLLVRVPPASQAHPAGVNGNPNGFELAVLVRGQQVQVIEASGPRSAGLAGFDLARAADTIAAYGHAELAVNVAGARMPVGYVRPRRLAPGVELLASGAESPAGRLVLRDAAAPDLFSPTCR
jgi:UvrD-like helicase C-terminal domain